MSEPARCVDTGIALLDSRPSGPHRRRRFLAGTAAATALLGRAPAALAQQVKELQVWHTEVEPQTVKTIADTSIAEFEKKFPGFKIKQQALAIDTRVALATADRRLRQAATHVGVSLWEGM